MFDHYVSRPWHLIFSLLLFELGSVCVVSPGWVLFGWFTFLVAFCSMCWIVYAGLCDAYARYVGDSVSDVLPPSFSSPSPHSDSDVTNQSLRVDLYSGTRSQHFELPISSSKLRPLAEGLLNGRPFSERTWSSLLSSSEFRMLRQVLRTKELIEPVSDKDPRQGFRLTDAGRQLMSSVLPSPTHK